MGYEALLPGAITAYALDVTVMMWNFAANPNESGGKHKNLYTFVKMLLIPSLAAVYVCAADKVDFHIALYLLFSWVGDIVLLGPGFFFTGLGGFCFCISHFIMVNYFAVPWKMVPTISYFFMLPGLIIHYGILVPKLSFKTYHAYGILTYCTVLEISAVNAAGRLAYLSMSSLKFWFSYLGYFCFIISDYFLVTVQLHLQKKLCRIQNLGSYVCAQTFLIFSALMKN